MPITFTLDLEDHRAGTPAPLRCGPPTERILDWLAAEGATGTFFIVGDLAERVARPGGRVADGHRVRVRGEHHAPRALASAEHAADVRPLVGSAAGQEFRVILDFGAGFIDHRGWFQNAGA